MERYLEILKKFLDQSVESWNKLSRRNQIIALASAVAAIALLTFFVWSMRQVAYRPLYADLPETDAGAAVRRLTELQIPYKLANGGTTILVPEPNLDELRLQLASEGLPERGRLGFELFDQNNFGATEFAEQVNFQRALEGELGRTIISLEEVKTARVHLTLPKRSVFLDSRQPAKASVVLELMPGAELTPEKTRAITKLVGSAVQDLPPEAVVVIDTSGRLFVQDRSESERYTEEQIRYQREIEREIVRKVIETLEPNVGAGGLRANAVVECDWDSGEQTEEILDPDAVLMTSQTSSESTDLRLPAGAPGTDSNLPRDPADPDANPRDVSRSVQTHNYETSKTITHMKLERGAVKRMSVAVVVDYRQSLDADETQIVRLPRPPEELEALRDLAAAAAGIVPERGDLLAVRSLPFTILEAPLALPAPPLDPSDKLLTLEWFTKYRIHLALGAIISLLGGVLIWWLRKRQRVKKQQAEQVAAIKAEEERQALQAAQDAQGRKLLEDEERQLKGLEAPVGSTKARVLKKHLEEMIKDNPQQFAKLLQGWIKED